MRPNALHALFAEGATAVNGWLSNDSPYVAETLSYAGFDAVTVDLQHGMFGLDAAVRLLQAVSAGPAVPMARCPSLDAAVIGKLLDAGAYGIICPDVDTAEKAERFVAACRYPPVGSRSFGPARALLYGGSDYAEHADDTVLTWAMVESRTSLANLASILGVPGLDGVFVGPNDLALSLGLPPGRSPLQPELDEALLRVVAAAHSAGCLAGVFSWDAATSRRLAEAGYDLVTPGNDLTVLRQASAERIAVVRGQARSPD